MVDIAAVVVTFNRKALLIECLDALCRQTLEVSLIYVIDNASSDGTREALLSVGLLDNPRIKYVPLPANLGGAGGFYEGMRMARDGGHDWVWVMDDDAEPEVDCLEIVAPYLDEDEYLVVAPAVKTIDGNFDTKSPHRGVISPRPDENLMNTLAIPLTENDLNSASKVSFDHVSFVGPLFSRRTLQEVGLPKKEMFIHYDDSEYSSRIKKAGKMIVISNAVILHKEDAKNAVYEVKHVWGRKSNRTPYSRLWLSYYRYRNWIWFRVKNENIRVLLPILREHFLKTIGVIVYDDHKVRRTIFWFSSLIDGVSGRFDNDKPKKLLRLP